jgi:hypothetical protein
MPHSSIDLVQDRFQYNKCSSRVQIRRGEQYIGELISTTAGLLQLCQCDTDTQGESEVI